MLRPTGFADLAGRRVGIFGYGIEGHATHRRLRALAASLVLVDDAPARGRDVLVTTDGGHEALLTCDAVVKSPGIPRRRPDVLDLEDHGVVVCSALNLWLHDVDRSRVVAVTGTKGKSTTTALIAFFLRCAGDEAHRVGNSGRPPYDPQFDDTHGWLVVEVSSYQCVDIDVAPSVVVVTSLGADHLDWHGSLEQYRDDKLSLTRAEGWHRTLVADQATLREAGGQLGGDVTYVAPDDGGLVGPLGLLGAHNTSNVALALACVTALTERSRDEVIAAVADRAASFVPLPGRLTLVATHAHDGGTVRFVDDGLATAPLPTLAALAVFADEPVALIAGGYDRGVDYTGLSDALAARRPATTLVTMGDAGRRLAEATRERAPGVVQYRAATMGDAVAHALNALGGGGVVLLSPAAPSFDRYHDWEERSRDFAREVNRSLGRDSNP